jgi:hypothetical protein
MLAAPFAKNSRVNLRAVDQPPRSQLFNFQWPARSDAGSRLLLFNLYQVPQDLPQGMLTLLMQLNAPHEEE